MQRILALIAVPLVFLACSESAAPTAVPEPTPPALLSRGPAAVASHDDLLKAVRRETARFHSTTQATKAGYQETHHCVPQMGFHWVNPSLVDPNFDPMQPEVVLYAPGPNGQLELVAVEYIVMDNGQGRPSLGDHPFDIGGTPIPASHWSLHVWLYENNPDGIFTAPNPVISCS